MDDLIIAYEFKVVEPGCAPGSGRYGLQVDVKDDISPVFPYLNATLNETRYDHQNCILIWREDNKAFALRPHEIKIVLADGLKNATDYSDSARDIVERINNVWRRRQLITPCFTEKGRPSVMEIYKLLPRTNCRQCGYPTCLVYAADLRDGKTKLENCIPILKSEYAGNKQRLIGLLST